MDDPTTEAKVMRSHRDVTGNWGGVKAWIVHFALDEDASPPGRMEIYRHVGEYHEVGNWPDDYGPSKWEVVNRCVEFLDGESSLTGLIVVVFGHHVRIHWGYLGRIILELGDLKHKITEVLRWHFR